MDWMCIWGEKKGEWKQGGSICCSNLEILNLFVDLNWISTDRNGGGGGWWWCGCSEKLGWVCGFHRLYWDFTNWPPRLKKLEHTDQVIVSITKADLSSTLIVRLTNYRGLCTFARFCLSLFTHSNIFLVMWWSWPHTRTQDAHTHLFLV